MTSEHAAANADYLRFRSIATGYDDFVAGTPLCAFDRRVVDEVFPGVTPQSATVVDFGCGTGRTAIPLADRGYRVVAVDGSDAMLEVLALKCGGRPITPVKADLTELSGLEADSADGGVCLFATLGMIAGHGRRRRFLGHVSRVLRRGSPLVLHVHHRWADLVTRGGWRRLAVSAIHPAMEFGDHVYPYRNLPRMFMHRYSGRELRRDLAATGFGVRRWIAVDLTGDGPAVGRGPGGGFIVVAEVA